MIAHHPNCNASYPEKVKSEPAQFLTDIDIGDGEIARTCVDCGAFEIVSSNVESKGESK